ncbi:protein Son isoform X2 [Cylas formicarius]|uniref:protein Son isoform X2 n=1 Tax=Cylas formicarius TaxID=197179 RepID=UPI002958DAFC|nr:protein Son isoform X2 [Cylas formicarius]
MSIVSENSTIEPKLEKNAEETKRKKNAEEHKLETAIKEPKIEKDAQKPKIQEDVEESKKSSMQILSELFSTFDAEPPVIVKKEKKIKGETHKKIKKSKRKHKHKDKDKKHKKNKKRKRSNSLSSNETEIDLAEILIKQEKNVAEKKIKIEGTSLTAEIKEIKQAIVQKEGQHHRSKNKGATPTKPYKKDERELIDKKHKKSKHKEKKSDKKRRSISRHRSRSREKKSQDLRNKIKYSKSPESSSKHVSKEQVRDCGQRSRERNRETSREHRTYRNNSNDNFYKSRFRDDSNYRSRYKDSEQLTRDKYRRNRDKSRSRERHRESDSSYIDKKKLLEIARRNAILMMKSGNLPGALALGPQAQEKVIAAIKSGGKTIEELTDFCKSLSKKEELGELSSLSGNGSDTDELFHHPFQIKDRPTSITINIKNSVPLPTKTTQERTTELRMQFPVSSGQQHRVNEEWIPVAPSSIQKSVENVKPKVVLPTEPIASRKGAEAPVATVKPLPPLSSPTIVPIVEIPAPPVPEATPIQSSDIGSIVSQRLTAMRKLQENPNDVQALSQMYKSTQEMKSWAESKQQFGQFTGSTGAQIMSQTELASGYQAWAKKDQLQTAAPVSGGMGMHLLQKMGWKPGEGLGKEKTGALEPLLLEVKLDKRGLVANEEESKQSVKKKIKGPTVKNLQGKHPVSLLGEYTSKKKIGAPQYILEFECGPDHKKNFLFKVIVNGVEYKPNVASANKKEAKAVAATIALQQIGLLP